jgi:Asp-tRNA(Asn)/Glu-tRNA(Gln) amidotransferase A subunit family amidase
VADAAVLLQILAGYDERDTTSVDAPVDDYLAQIRKPTTSMRVGVPRSFFYEGLDREVASATAEALAVLGTMTKEIREVEVAVNTDRTLQTAESYAYHAENVAKTPDLYQPETLRRIRTGATVSAADYIQRRRELEEARRHIRSVFKSVDVLVTPTVPIPPPTICELKEHPENLRPREILLLRNTRPVNVWGLPAISIPCGFTHAGLPIGLQIIGPHWREGAVLSLAHAYEQATAWHKRRPRICAGVV